MKLRKGGYRAILQALADKRQEEPQASIWNLLPDPPKPPNSREPRTILDLAHRAPADRCESRPARAHDHDRIGPTTTARRRLADPLASDDYLPQFRRLERLSLQQEQGRRSV